MIKQNYLSVEPFKLGEAIKEIWINQPASSQTQDLS